MNRKAIGSIGIGVWALAVAAGFVVLHVYESTPEAAAREQRPIQRSGDIPFVQGRNALVMAAHPRCPCTRASLEEFGRILERSSQPVDAYVLFYRPRDSDWSETDLWRRALAIPGVKVQWDDGGAAADRLGARTSGHTLLFDPDGRLLFSGGLTALRGQFGPSKGGDALTGWLTHGQEGEREALVFGCPLSNSIGQEGLPECHRPE